MINTREIATEYRLSHWAQIIHERIESGLTIKAYCKQIGICGNTYHYWQRKLREAACQELLPVVSKQKTKEKISSTQIAPAGWAVCETTPSESNDKSIVIEIGKSRITADGGTDLEMLANVCRMLMSLC